MTHYLNSNPPEEPEQERVIIPEGQKVIAWRELQLLQAGVKGLAARRIALATDVDLHQALKLKALGAADRHLVRILL